MSRPERSTPLREPIRMPWVWAGLIALIMAGVPWYLPEGVIGPTIAGFPVWTLVAIASSLAVCGYLSWMLLRQWNLVEDEEEGAGHAREPHTAGTNGQGIAGEHVRGE